MDALITVVSGLPRSGTSMMMSMIKAGGMDILVDNIRRPDEDNPKGYYEFEKVKKTKEDSSWLKEAENKAVKMVTMLLRDLPSDRGYKIIFMKREMAEVLASQRRMLERLEMDSDGTSDEEMGRVFEKHLLEIENWLKKQENMDVQYVSYNDVIRCPSENAKIVNRFLDNILDTGKMVQVIDQSLYRQRDFSEKQT